MEAHILLANSYAALDNVEQSLQEMQQALKLAPDRPRSYVNLAQLQANAKQAAAAEASFKKAIELDPKSISAFLALGNFYTRQRRWADAEQQFRKAIELEPKNPQPRGALARLYVAQGEKSQAEQTLMEAKRALPDNSEGYRMLGDFYFSLGEVDKALAEYASLYQEHPKDLRVKKNYIQLLILRNRLSEAARLNDEILKANAKDVDALVYRGQILNRQGRPNDAIPIFESALKADADNAVGHYNLGLAFRAVGNLAQAESEFREAARLRPNMVGAQQALADLALRKGDADQLSQSAEKLIAAEPLSPNGYILRSTARIAENDLAGAETDLKKAIEVAPQSPRGYTAMGGLRATQKRFSEAAKLYEQALERDPNYTDALKGLVNIYIGQKQPAKALARVNAQIAKEPNNSSYYLLQGMTFIGTKQLDKAEAAFQKASELDKTNMEALLFLGQVQAAQGSIDKAIASNERSIQENPRDVRAYIMLGTLEEARGNWQKAQDAYQKGLQVDPDNPLACNNLAYLMLEHGGNVDVALSYAQRARQGMPDSTSSADTLAWAYYKKGSYGLAIDLLEEAVKKAPQNATYHYHLGMSYQGAGKAQLAKQHLEKALEINPHLPQAEEIRTVLATQAGM